MFFQIHCRPGMPEFAEHVNPPRLFHHANLGNPFVANFDDERTDERDPPTC